MGKSKKARRADDKALRDFQRQRKIMKWVTIAVAVLLVLAAAFTPVWGDKAGVVLFVMFILYILAFIGLRMSSRCIYCGQSIMRKFEQQTHCPYCKRPIKPSTPGRNTLAGK